MNEPAILLEVRRFCRTLQPPGGMVVAEHRRNFDLPEAPGALERFRVLTQGDAALSFYRHLVEVGF